MHELVDFEAMNIKQALELVQEDVRNHRSSCPETVQCMLHEIEQLRSDVLKVSVQRNAEQDRAIKAEAKASNINVKRLKRGIAAAIMTLEVTACEADSE